MTAADSGARKRGRPNTGRQRIDADYDAVIIGGGFYGCAIASFLGRHDWRVNIIERENDLMQRASYANQARLHNGYHYPRSFRTAVRSRVNCPKFQEVFPEAVIDGFRALYAVARFGSRVSANHFERFCRAGRIPLRLARKNDVDLFDRRLIENVYEVEELAFDANALRDRMAKLLTALQVEVTTGRKAVGVAKNHIRGRSRPVLTRLDDETLLSSSLVFNCTYADLNHIGREIGTEPSRREKAVFSGADRFGLIHMIAEVALISPPEPLVERGITVMDGPFFSVMPFPPRGLHSLTHVKYTHHLKWKEAEETRPRETRNGERPSPTEILARYLRIGGGVVRRSRFNQMIRDARRYVPALGDVTLADSLIDVKTLPVGTNIDDARPILFHQDKQIPELISILGGKIDNIFDIFSYLREKISLDRSCSSGLV